jgi:tetratricopeptide (TPR) repeat protein
MDLSRSTTVVVLGLVGVVLGAVGLWSLKWWVGAGALAIVAVVALAGFWLERNRALTKLLRFKPVKLGELDAIQCGVDKTAPWLLEKTDARAGEYLLSFVSRQEARMVGHDLAAAVRANRSVLVGLVGESKAGKTRCVLELVRHRVPDAVLFAPRASPEAVRELIGLRRFRWRRRWTVLWLDDLEHFIDPMGGGGVDDALVAEVLALPRVVVAVTAGDHLGIKQFEDAPTLPRVVPGEGHDGQQIVSVLGQALADAIGEEGLGAACVAGPVLVRIHRSGQHPNFEGGNEVPEGVIVVECLIAAAQLGLGALTREQLLDVYRQTETQHASKESFDRGLRWGLTTLHGEVAPVLAHADTFRAYSYVVENAKPVGEYRKRAEHALVATIDTDDVLAIADRACEIYDFVRALRLYELALARITDQAVQGAVINTIGLMQSALGMLEDALASHQRALTIMETVYRPDHPEVAITLGNVGNVQRELGEFEAARDTQQRALTIKETVYGPDHPQVASTLNNLGNVQRELGEFEAARDSQQRALAIMETVYGPDHPQVASTLGHLGNVQRELGEFEAARDTQQRALTIMETVYRPDHPEVAITLGNLGNVQRELGEFEAARETQQRALAIMETVYGPDHPQVASTLNNLGILQKGLGEFEAARDTLQRALTIKETVYEPDHPQVASTLGNLGVVQRELGELEAAEENMRRALAILQARLPDDHQRTRQARRQLARLVAARGEVLLNIRDDHIEPADPNK